jgi:hypothetical protein
MSENVGEGESVADSMTTDTAESVEQEEYYAKRNT